MLQSFISGKKFLLYNHLIKNIFLEIMGVTGIKKNYGIHFAK